MYCLCVTGFGGDECIVVMSVLFVCAGFGGDEC